MAVQVLRGRVILPDRVVEHGLVVVADGLIQAVVEEGAGAPYAVTHDLGDHYVAPGFVDVHTHGIAGADTMDASPAAVALMARRVARHGVTAFLPTTMTQSLDLTLRAIRAVRAYMQQPLGGDSNGDGDGGAARVLGLHLEGPWISREYKGAQNERYIAPPTAEMVRQVLEAGGEALRIVSLAPELPGAEEAIGLLRRAGVGVSVGHTAATYEQVTRAIELGATGVTHCFNAMTPLHHRRPGAVGAALLHDALYAELIADGVHVHPAAMRLLVQLKGRERVVLITDAMSATELPDGAYALGGQEVVVRQGQARLADGTLAGSTLTMDVAVRTLVTLCAVPIPDAVYMASAAPAAVLGLGHRTGRIAPGYDADLALLDARLDPAGIMLAGTITLYE